MPAVFALGDQVIGNPTLATFAAFGAFAQLLLVDFPGPMGDRLLGQAALAAVGAVFVVLGTLASNSTWLAAAAMTVVGFGVLFAGVVSSVLAGATTSLLLAFILPVSLPGPASSIPDRLAGWGIASGAALLAIALLWPAPARDPVRGALIAACRAMAARMRSEVALALGGESRPSPAEHEAAVTAATGAVAAMQRAFVATPYRPTGLGTAARAAVRLVDELKWLDAILAESTPPTPGSDGGVRACGAKSSAAEVLDRAADLLDTPGHSAGALRVALADLSEVLAELERVTTMKLPSAAASSETERVREVVSSLDPSFRAQEVSYVVSQIARNVDFAAAAERRSWIDRLLGRQPAGLAGPLAAAQERAGSHVERHSLWLRNSVRGAAGLGLAVLVADLTGVQHAFWVVLGTLAVLRSNAVNTGQSVVRGLLGTAAGFVVGAALVSLIGTDSTLLWVLLPPAVLLAGLAPAVIGFATGQAAFTLVLLILFNLIQPAGWTVGLVRIEDVALGGAVSLAVGVLFWPRGAAAALSKALAEAYVDSARYLSRAVEFGMDRCDSRAVPTPAPKGEAANASAASRRLDDTFRGYVAERGAKPAPLNEIASLVTGVAALRLTADAVLDLWQSDDPAGGDRGAARREVLANAERMTRWYDQFAEGLLGRGTVPDPLARDTLAEDRLVDAVGHDLRDEGGEATATAVRMIWTGDHLDAARRLQGSLVGPAREVAPA